MSHRLFPVKNRLLSWSVVLALFLCCLVLPSCAKTTYNVATNCDRSQSGNYVLRWEVKPAMSGNVNIYISDKPEIFPSEPSLVIPIKDNVATVITTDNMSQKYFLMEFAGRVSTVASMRVFPMHDTFNFRDAGGYDTYDGMYMKWGMLYRSGRLGKFSVADSITVSQLGIKTIVYLEDDERVLPRDLKKIPGVNVMSIPADKPVGLMSMLQDVVLGKKSVQDIRTFYDLAFKTYAFSNAKQLQRALNVLLDARNYPVLLMDRWGKDRISLLIYLLQNSLELPSNFAVEDYLLSNQVLSLRQLLPEIVSMPLEHRERVAAFFTSDDIYLSELRKQINEEYGSLAAYMEKVLGIDANKRKLLKQILLE